MRPLPLLLAFLAPVAALAQSDKNDRLMDDLCTCISRIDAGASDARVDGGVRHCLEDAVVTHPGEVLDLLHDRPASANKAFDLGLALGGSLERDCPHFHLIRARLQQMPPRTSGKKGT